jgi:sugar porter (SP) family MFS transporter
MIGGVYGNLGAIYAGRFIAGLGVGQTAVVGPIYIAEVAPTAIRGVCTCFFTGAVYIGIVLAYFTNYGAHLNIDEHSHNQWLVPTSLHLLFAGLGMILSFFQYESPRFLVKQGKSDKAAHALAKLRKQDPDSDYIVGQIAAIQAALDHELEATQGVGWLGKVKELFLDKSNLYRLYLATMVQVFAQWSGAGSITLYAPDLFKLIGVTGQNEGLLVTAVFGVVKLVAAISCALFLVDVIGRKRALVIGVTLQGLSMVYVAGFLTAFPKLGVDDSYVLPDGHLGVSRGAIAMIYISGIGWALGWNSIQYLLTAELFPLRIRALATSWSMSLHFASQYGNSRAVPNMLLPTSDGGISPKGTFWCFAAVTILGGLWVWISIPETSGRSLESMDRLFELPWYRIGLYGNKDADAKDLVYNEKERAAEEQIGEIQEVEKRA